MGDILGSGINVGAQYANIRGLYTEGDDISVDLDAWLSDLFTATVRLDRYLYTVNGNPEQFRTLTGSANILCRISRTVYALVNYDQVWDSVQDARRLFLELGVRF
jgi:hypothetical protein